MMPWEEMVIRTAISLALVTIGAVGYACGLIWIGNHLKGWAKSLLAISLYFIFAFVVIAPFLYIISSATGMVLKNGYTYLAAVFIAWIASIVPAFFYIFKIKLVELRGAGFFLP